MTPRTRTANPLVAALDTADVAQLEAWAGALGPEVGHLKVGLEAFVALGARAVRVAGAAAPVFLDLKLHDIPATVAGAARSAAALDVALLTVHASGGAAMVEAAVRAAPGVGILAVTVLTSLDADALASVGQPPVDEQVSRLATLAVEAGARGIVCAPTDVAVVRAAVGDEPLLVVPGVRPPGTSRDDQARVAEPSSALASGADLLVLGRPLTRAADPAAAARDLLDGLRRPA